MQYPFLENTNDAVACLLTPFLSLVILKLSKPVGSDPVNTCSKGERDMRKKTVKTVLVVLLCLMLTGAGAIFGIDVYIRLSTSDRILNTEQAAQLKDVDCILVLGCQVKSNGVPSDMLADRLRRGVELYKADAAPKLLMSGDHGQTDYNEVRAMKQYAIDSDIVSSDIFMDHAGFSTYESMYRAKHIFEADKIIIVTQKYHLHRALHIARSLGIDAYGVAADYRSYTGQTARDVREVLARIKDFGTGIFQPKPTYLGSVIPISGDGNLTND